MVFGQALLIIFSKLSTPCHLPQDPSAPHDDLSPAPLPLNIRNSRRWTSGLNQTISCCSTEGCSGHTHCCYSSSCFMPHGPAVRTGTSLQLSPASLPGTACLSTDSHAAGRQLTSRTAQLHLSSGLPSSSTESSYQGLRPNNPFFFFFLSFSSNSDACTPLGDTDS